MFAPFVGPFPLPFSTDYDQSHDVSVVSDDSAAASRSDCDKSGSGPSRADVENVAEIGAGSTKPVVVSASEAENLHDASADVVVTSVTLPLGARLGHVNR